MRIDCVKNQPTRTHIRLRDCYTVCAVAPRESACNGMDVFALFANPSTPVCHASRQHALERFLL